MAILNDDRLFPAEPATRAIARRLYHSINCMPILSPHGHADWGHSMIVGPWGDVVAQQAEGEGIAIAEVDRERQAQTRATFPALVHRRG